MALKLKKSPLTARVEPPQPLRQWVWTTPGPYHGAYAPNAAGLLPLLNAPGRLLRLETGGLCLLFDSPQELDPAQIAALPLRRVGPEAFASYEAPEVAPQSLAIIHHGAPQQISLQGADPVNPLTLWDFSGLQTDPALPLPGSPTAIPKAGKARPEAAPERNRKLQTLSKEPKVFDNLRAEVDSTKDPQMSAYVRNTGRLVGRLLATILLLLIYLWVMTVALRLGGGLGPFGFIAALVFLAWFFGLFQLPGQVGRQSSEATESSSRWGQAHGVAKPRRQSLLNQLRGMALWNTSFGNNLRQQVQRHLDEVNQMIDRGDIDRALKRALSLAQKEAEAEKKRSPLMTALPKPRANLDFNLNRTSDQTVTLPGDWGFEEVRNKYHKLAEDLSAKGDHRRAAFIYSELLDNVPAALAELEKLKAYEDAAKLAMARNQLGATQARLWYLAGEKEVALLVARRRGAMQTLAEISEKDAEFAAFVRRHWIDDLITEGDLPRAVAESADRPQLAELHLRVLGQAVAAGHLSDLRVLERAVQGLPWPLEALDAAPKSDLQGDTIGHEIACKVHEGVAAPEAGPLRHALKTAAERMAPGDPHKAALTDAVIRASLAHDAHSPHMIPIADLRRFAKAGGCSALAEDLRQIRRGKPGKPLSKRWIDLPNLPSSQWSMAAALPNGAALLGSHSGALAMVDATGAKRWTDHLPDLVDMVPIAAGRNVLLLQGTSSLRRITLLDTARRSYRSLGSTKLLAWGAYAGDGIWQVQTPEAIGALDLSAYLAEPSALEWLWSITQTIPVQAVGFSTSETVAEWITQRQEPQTRGLLELWSLDRRTQSLNVWLEEQDKGEMFHQSPHLWHGNMLIPQRSSVLTKKTFDGTNSLAKNERSLLQQIGRQLRRREHLTQITALRPQSPLALQVEPDAQPAIELEQTPKDRIARLYGHDISTQASSNGSGHLVIVTESGVAVLCDFDRMSAVAI